MLIARTALTGVAVAASILAQAAPAARPQARGIVSHAVSKRGYLGVGVQAADGSGIEVKKVDENSPAAKAGVKEGDVIVELNGKKIEDVEEFIRNIGDAEAGAKATLTVQRGGAKQTLTATLQNRPLQQMVFRDLPELAVMPPMPPMPVLAGGVPQLFTGQTPRVGFEGETLSPQLAEFFGVKEGVLVRTVNAKTPAEKAGLKAGDVITKVSGTPVTTPREISALVLASHKNFTFTVVRNHREITLNVEVAAATIPSPEREVL